MYKLVFASTTGLLNSVTFTKQFGSLLQKFSACKMWNCKRRLPNNLASEEKIFNGKKLIISKNEKTMTFTGHFKHSQPYF